ncbi:MAG TPA: SNF2-related protein [Roseiflexaceae bacterium]|nr:SNF2-related protein [Roseiflexaceae bacterium]
MRLLTAESIDTDRLFKLSTPQVIQHGRNDYAQDRVELGTVGFTEARATVQMPNTSYTVLIRMQNDQITLICSCNQGHMWTLCRHRVATVLALRDYLLEHPPSMWKAVLKKAAPVSARSTSNAQIVFCLQNYGNQWLLHAYAIADKHIPDDLPADPFERAEYIADHELFEHARPINNRIVRASYPRVHQDAIIAVNLLTSSSGYGYYSGYGGDNTLDTVLPLMRNCVLFAGTDDEPFETTVKVEPEPVPMELSVVRHGSGLRLHTALRVPDDDTPFEESQVDVIVRKPLWVLVDDRLLQVSDSSGVGTALLDNPQLDVPQAEVEEFLTEYLLPLSEQLPVNGDAISWQDVDVDPVPRLYLSEEQNELMARLAFGYGAYELPYAKRTPPTSTIAKPGTLEVARIARRPEAEQTAVQALSGHSLKRTDRPEVFALRKNAHPVDFLLHQVPKLTAQGFEIYGEEALTSARVNRNRPILSFSVSTGIDWFDVKTVVNYGELTVALKDIRKALRKRERFIKLADGTIGSLPQDWIERYRHLFALGEETGDGMRISTRHLTLLDQILADSERARTDPEFERRRQRLRDFSSIQRRDLPRGFVGELRPYQHAGYNWLHFLHDYDFGGCLADDMGTGKCLLGTSELFVNGTLLSAEQLWERYAGAQCFDGEGYWAEPGAPLLVNAIDSGGRIVQAPIRRLYRQQVRERLRRVTLEDGSSVTITRRHRLLGRDGWTTAFKPGDYVCVPSRLVWPGAPLDRDLVTFLAWQIAEGYEQRQSAVLSITQNDGGLLEELRRVLLRLAERYDIAINQPNVVAWRDKAPYLRVSSRAYQAFLEQQGYVWGNLSRDKRIPDFVMQGDQDSVRLFLRNFFEAEGSVMQGGRGIEISSASAVLMRQIATLLRRFGIWLRVHPKQKRATNGSGAYRSYQIGLISGNGMRRFLREIGFVGERKQRRLEAACQQASNTNIEGVPASDIVAEAVVASGLPVRHFGMHNTVYLDGSQQFSRASLAGVSSIDRVLDGSAERAYRSLPRSKWTAQTLAAYEHLDHGAFGQTRQRIQGLLDQEVFFCRVATVEEIDHEGWVYDVEVAEHHNFVAENMLCHNTIQTLAFLQSLREAEPNGPASLIVMPRSLLFNWEREAQRFTPDLQVYIHADQGRVRSPEEFGVYDLVLTTYGVMLRDIELLRGYRFHYAILDESQAIKNPLSETARAARQLISDHRLALTGTPVENSTAELWSQFAFLNPGLLGSLEYFREEFVNPIERKQDQETARFLSRMVYPFILRRTKEQVATDLPELSERLLETDMEPAQRALYDKQRDYYRSLLLGLIEREGLNDTRLKILEGLLRLRQICNHPRLVDASFKGSSAKFELLIETLDTLRAEGHKALVFSQFVQMLGLVREALDDRTIPYAYLDGQTQNRQAVVDAFQQDPKLPFFLISLKAGGVGLNLTAADYVIHIDPWWNPAVEMQATDRAHRIGQDKPVFVYKLVTRDSVEQKILALQERKRALVEQIIAPESSFLKSLTRDDVEVLFS